MSLKPSWVAWRQRQIKLWDARDGLCNCKITLQAHCLHTYVCICDRLIQGSWEKRAWVSGPTPESSVSDEQVVSVLRAEWSGTAGKAVAAVSVQFKPMLTKMFIYITFLASFGRQKIQANITKFTQHPQTWQIVLKTTEELGTTQCQAGFLENNIFLSKPFLRHILFFPSMAECLFPEICIVICLKDKNSHFQSEKP